MTVALALAPSVTLAETEAGGETPPKKSSPWKSRRKSALNFELGFDSNAQRAISAGDSTLFLTPDLLAYLFASTEWVLARPGHSLRAEVEVGGKLFLETSEANMLAVRLRLAHDHRLGRRWILSTSATYRDKFQIVRDYRQASLESGFDLLAGSRVLLRWRVRASAFDYQVNREFSYLAPGTELTARWKISTRNSATLAARFDQRLYHPDSKVYEEIPGGSFVESSTQANRRDATPTLRLGWAYRSTFLISLDGAVSRSISNSFGVDTWRFRLDGSIAYLLRRGTSLVLTGAVQAATFPEGNIYGASSLIADETERQTSVTLRFSHALGKVVSGVVKVQFYANELGPEVPPFSRLVVQGGISSRF